MGAEFGQFIEWNYTQSLDWHLLDYPMHKSLWEYNKALNWFYRANPTLWEQDHSWEGFEWIDPNDYEQSVVSFIRKGKDPHELLVVVVNFTPVVRYNYRLGVPIKGIYKEVFNSDYKEWGGSGVANLGVFGSEDTPWHNQEQSIAITLPPLAAVYFRLEKVLAERSDHKTAFAYTKFRSQNV